MSPRIILLFILLLGGSIHASAKKYSITVRVTDELTNLPVKGALVQIKTPRKTLLSAYTDRSGVMTIKGLKSRLVYVCVSGEKEKYKPYIHERHNLSRRHLSQNVVLTSTKKYQQQVWAMEDSVYGTWEDAMRRPWTNGWYDLNDYDFYNSLRGFLTYVDRNAQYPDKAYDENTSGNVTLHFVIEKDGTLTHIKAAEATHDEFEQEARRLLAEEKNWAPLEYKGEKIRTACSIKFTFQVYSF